MCSAVALAVDDAYECDEFTIEEQVSDFLEGRSAGAELLRALYDHILEESIPARLSVLLRG
jgi:hypothetical protein